MALYDYGNTRLRARLSELLPIDHLESFAGLYSIDSLISALTKTPYKESIEEALTYAHGYECVNQAMKIASAKIYDDLMNFYRQDTQSKIQMIFYRSDLQNLKAVFRGVLHQIPLEQITQSFSHMGTISENVLQQLVKSEDLDELINRLAVFQLPVSHPLLELRNEQSLINSSDIEVAMEKWYFHEIKKLLRGNLEDIRLLREFYQIEADIVNLNTALRFVGSERGHAEMGDRIGEYWIDGGSLSVERWMELVSISRVEKLVQGLFNTRYKPFLSEAINCYQSTKMLSEFETQMRMYLLTWLSGLPRSFPLGIGVPMGYVALLRSEIKNIRWIAKGIVSGFSPDYIREKLERLQ